MQHWEVAAGELRQRVTIQGRAQIGVGDRGEPVFAPDWTDELIDVPAKVEQPLGRKLEIAQQLVASATHAIEMHWREGVTVFKRVVFGDRVLDIGHANDVESRHRKLILTCIEEKP